MGRLAQTLGPSNAPHTTNTNLMPILDFTEIPMAGSGQHRDAFELFARDFLDAAGYIVVTGPDRGPDAGRDLVVSEIRTGIYGETRISWLVSCKHKANSGQAVSPADEPDIHDRVLTHKCKAFLGFYSTVPSSGLATKFSSASDSFEIQILDQAKIEAALLSNSKSMSVVAHRYFPVSYENWRRSLSTPAKIFSEETDLFCDYCNKSLLKPKPHGIVVLWHPYSSEDGVATRTEHMYWCCKGACDERLRQKYLLQRLIDGWEDIDDLVIPTMYIRWAIGIMNQLQKGETWSREAFERNKDLLLNIFPYVSRHLSDTDKDRVSDMRTIPISLGGMP